MKDDNDTTNAGTIGWHDLTVPDAPGVRDFYSRVVGWKPEAVPMGDYDDFNMTTADGTPVAGVCHARGSNAGLPPIWLMYVVVPDLDASVAETRQLGGEVVDGPRPAGGGRICIVRDPAGAVLGLYQE